MSDERRDDKTDDDRARKAVENPLEEAARGSWDVPGRNWAGPIVGALVLVVLVLVFAWVVG